MSIVPLAVGHVANLLSELRTYLVSTGLVRVPSVAGPKPPLWLEPKTGIPAPGEGNNPVEVGQDLVLGAFLTGGFVPEPYGSWLRKPVVDVQFRGRNVQTIEQLELDISLRLIDRRDFMLGAMYVIECEQWRPMQRVSSDEQGYNYVTSYWFELYRPEYGTITSP